MRLSVSIQNLANYNKLYNLFIRICVKTKYISVILANSRLNGI